MTKRLFLIVLILTVTSCYGENVNSPQDEKSSSKTIFFQLRNESEERIEIWQTNVGTSYQQPLLTVSTQYPVSALPEQELLFLKQHVCIAQEDKCPHEFDFGVNNLQLSPDKKQLAWEEGASWCPGTVCYGFKRIMVWDLMIGKGEMLLELPFHIDGASAQTLGNIAWSPNSKKIGFVINNKQQGWSRIQSVDVGTKQTQVIGEGHSPFAWAPDGQNMALTIRRGNGWRVAIVNVGSGEIVTTFGDDSWNLITGVDWAPGASRLAITALVDYQGTSNRTAYNLFIAHVTEKQITAINPARCEVCNYSQPHWSPIQNLLGFNLSREEDNKRLVIFDFEEEVIKVTVTPEHSFDHWLWSDDGTAILLLTGDDYFIVSPFFPKRINVFYWQDNEFETIPFPPQLEEELEQRHSFISEPTW